jgi:hypothetical protein
VQSGLGYSVVGVVFDPVTGNFILVGVDPVEDPAHAVVDYKPLSDGLRKNVAKLLRTRAQKRGRLFPLEARPKTIDGSSASNGAESA